MKTRGRATGSPSARGAGGGSSEQQRQVLSFVGNVVPTPVAPTPSFSTFAETPRYKGIIRPEERPLDRASAAAAALHLQQRDDPLPDWSFRGQQNRALASRFEETNARLAKWKADAQGGAAGAVAGSSKLTASRVFISGQGGLHTTESGDTVYEARARANKIANRRVHPKPPPIRMPVSSTHRTYQGATTPHSKPPPMPTTLTSLTASSLPSPRTFRTAAQRNPQLPKESQIGRPHRILPPPFMNAPARVAPPRSSDHATPSPRSKPTNHKLFLSQMQDYALRASACKRAGRRRAEANAYYSMGILYDNMGVYSKSVSCYKSFQAVLQSAEDKFTEALAHNSIGVAYQLLAEKVMGGVRITSGSGGGSSSTHTQNHNPYHQLSPRAQQTTQPLSPRHLLPLHHADDTSAAEQELQAKQEAERALAAQEKRTRYLYAAITHHQRHLDSADAPGRFVAFTNLGLCFSLLGNQAAAIQNHQQAIQGALQIDSVAGQAIAIGNLGIAARRSGDLETAKACMHRYREISQELGDAVGEATALRVLGDIASLQGEFNQAGNLLMQAIHKRPLDEVNKTRVNIGVARANALMQQHMQQLAQQMSSEPGMGEILNI